MDKKEALRVIFRCVELYDCNLKNKNFIFLSLDSTGCINSNEVLFLDTNFLHLTGVVTNGIKPKAFYNMSLKKRLSVDDIKFKTDGTTPLKLSVLPQLMNLHRNTNMIGIYDQSMPNLYIEMIAGNINACMGFILNSDGFYYPVTVLKEDMRKITVNKERIVAIFSKSIQSRLYSNLLFLCRNYDQMDLSLPSDVLSKIDLVHLVDANGIVSAHVNLLLDGIVNVAKAQVSSSSDIE